MLSHCSSLETNIAEAKNVYNHRFFNKKDNSLVS